MKTRIFWLTNGIILTVVGTLISIGLVLNENYVMLVVSIIALIVGLHLFAQNQS